MESSKFGGVDVGRWRSHDRTNDDEGVNREHEREVRSSSTTATSTSTIATRSSQGMNASSAEGKGEGGLGDGHCDDSKLVECAERAAHTQSVVMVVVDKGDWEEEENADAFRGDCENDEEVTAIETAVEDNSSSTGNLNPAPAPPESKSRIERRKEKKRRKKQLKKYGRDNASITNTTRTRIITTSTLPHQESQQFNNPKLSFYPHSHASYNPHNTTFSFPPQHHQQQKQQPFHSASPPFNYTTHQLAGGQYQHMPPPIQSNNPHSTFYPHYYASSNPDPHNTTFSFAQQQQQQLQQQYHQPQPLYSAPLPFNYTTHQLAGGQYQNRLPPLPPPPRPPPLTSSLTPMYYHHYNNDNNVELTIQNNNSNNHSTDIPKSIHLIVHVQPLIVLDLNGILCHRIRSRNFYSATTATTTTTTTTGSSSGLCYRNPCGYVAQTAIVPRTDLTEFLTLLNTHFTLAVWSSAKKKNAMVLVQMLFPPEISKQLLFVWGQNMCDIKPKMDNSNNDINNDVNKDVKTHSTTQSSHCDIIFIKSLCKVWKDYPLWDASNTVLLDDSPDKCPDMYRNNSIHPPPIHGRCMGTTSFMDSPPPPSATSFSHYSACSSSTTSASPLSDTVSTFSTDIGEGSDEYNQEKQRLFFRRLASFWSRANKGEKQGRHDCNNNREEEEDEDEDLFSFLKQHGTGHMGWRGLC